MGRPPVPGTTERNASQDVSADAFLDKLSDKAQAAVIHMSGRLLCQDEPIIFLPDIAGIIADDTPVRVNIAPGVDDFLKILAFFQDLFVGVSRQDKGDLVFPPGIAIKGEGLDPVP